MRRRLATVLLATLVVLSGCSGAAGGGGADSATVRETAVAEEPQRADSGDAGGDGGAATGGDGGDDGTLAAGRSIIRTGQVELRVDDFESARANLTATVEARGGYVSDSVQRAHDVDGATWLSGQVVLRVPAENFSATMDAVEGEGEVLESRTSTQDVTEQVVDLEARLRNLRAERDRLRTLYDRANTTEDVLAVERRLSEVQTEIERVEARLENLERRVAYSTITVELSEPRPDRPVPDQWYDTPVVAAFLDSVHGVGVALRALVVAGAYAAPYLIVFLSPFVALGALLYRFRRRIL
jgi:cell division septum initiation protein DivIVA